MRSSKYSPQAKKMMLRSGGDLSTPLMATVELASGTNPASMKDRLEGLGAILRGWSSASRIMTLQISPGRLDELGEIRGVTYIQVGSKLRTELQKTPKIIGNQKRPPFEGP